MAKIVIWSSWLGLTIHSCHFTNAVAAKTSCAIKMLTWIQTLRDRYDLLLLLAKNNSLQKVVPIKVLYLNDFGPMTRVKVQELYENLWPNWRENASCSSVKDTVSLDINAQNSNVVQTQCCHTCLEIRIFILKMNELIWCA